MWADLTAEGSIVTELGDYPWANHCGYVIDKYGIGWQVMVDAEDSLPFCGPSLVYSGAQLGTAAEAMDFYQSVFPDSTAGEKHLTSSLGELPEGVPDGLMWGFNTVWGQTLQYSDGYDGAPDFTPGASLDVRCDTQDEIDHLWEALSAVPAAEQCGWLEDKYGLSWQINVAGIEQLMNDKPGSWAKLMEMKKIVIAEL